MENYIEGAMTVDTLSGRMLTFILGGEIFGLEINYVTEIVGIQEITTMPEMPGYIKGIINLRGKIIPVMDVRLRFGMEPKPYDDRTCVIVVEFSDRVVGLVVDSVSEVLTIEASEILEVPKINDGINQKYLKNIGNHGGSVILIVDCESLLSEDALAGIEKTQD